jgi:hypothetical protein
MLAETNIAFCYWLQGFFEISQQPRLTKEKVELIQKALKNIQEPLGEYTQWLLEVTELFATQQYRQPLLDYFMQEIADRLNWLFHHVIDESYDTELSRDAAKAIHDGRSTHD